MKKILLVFMGLSVFLSCKKEAEKPEQVVDADTTALAPLTDEVMENAVIYEANIRQYSEEGSFKSFTKDIPKLKELGVKILWVMPIYPISTTKSKGSLGSYYAISDYTKVNPEFGSLEDFRQLVKTAHDNGIYVILDWVANHTGWDHVWLKEHPEYYTKDEAGNITHTVGTDWTDVADLNYDNTEMREQMISDMLYWVKEEKIDGFRCDVAGMVPVDFWEKAISTLKKEKPVFMLAEAWEPELQDNAFDMGYGWDTHHKMNDIAKGKENIEAWDHRMAQIDSMYDADDILMNFTSNHDENSWNGTVFERMGDGAEAFAALTYCAPGMPLIYSGQEYDMNKRLLFFEKDTIIKTKGRFYDIYKKLGQLKNNNAALNGGKKAASYKRISTSDKEHVLAFERQKDGRQLIYLANLSDAQVTTTVDHEGVFKNYMTGEEISLEKDKEYHLEPWEYIIYVND
ncbi:alpha-amylase [Leptobacterium flavescens]|uniref:Alpha-amylase n=1 Tax=Leptobacterium flavescens TaxID=472055 RepID=A0A6P0UW49_9FLAO|nr:alpha-amylase family glycosyl hydrolase [Leptobacterium flavescens]NER14656.1 alpha-amylase [Leptobacterium flavescens]